MSVLRRWAPRLALLVVSLLFCEAALQVGYRVVRHRWLFSPDLHDPAGMFVPHPYLAMVPKPGAVRRNGDVTISHSASGWRGPDLERPKTRTRVVVVGGSSTYCIGVDDAQTFPAQLQRLLGDRYEVINLGVPGYSSVEHVIQTALWFSDLQPDVAIYYMGWNDARNMHVRGLKADYSDFHGAAQQEVLGHHAGWWSRHSALAHLGANLARVLGNAIARVPRYRQLYPDIALSPTPTAWTPRLDPRPLELYRRNVDELVTLCRAQGVTPLFVPQLVNRAALTAETAYGWLPFVRDKDLPALVDAYNRVLVEEAGADSARVIPPASLDGFQPDDFIDNGHFSPAGCGKMAAILEQQIRRLPGGSSATP